MLQKNGSKKMRLLPTGNRGGKQGKLLAKAIATALIERLENRELLSTTPAITADTMHYTWVRKHPVGSIQPLAASNTASGVTAATMRKAYGMDSITFGSVTGDGTGQIIAIVDAYNEPTLATDLVAFDTKYSLPTANLIRVSQTGSSTLPSADTAGGWGVETALDVEWTHVMAPGATILLVEATSDSDANLYAAVDEARSYAGVAQVSMSWGGDEASTDASTNDSHFLTPSGHTGVTFLASSGDNGAYSDTSSTSTTKIVGYPAVSVNVVGIGGTNLQTGTGGVYSSETGWGSGTTSNANGGSGGGISKYAAQPSYQTGNVNGLSTTKRTVPDVSLDADPNSGVAVYSSYDNGSSTPWLTVGGTSLASPMWAGVMAVANQGRVIAGEATLNGATQTLPMLYSLPAADFHDITSGNNGYAAGTGYDLVTGRGSPVATLLIPGLVGTVTPTPAIGSLTVSPSSVVVGTSVTLTAGSVTETGGTVSSVSFYRETNGTTGFQSTDTLVGTGTQNGSTWTLTPVATTGFAAGTTTFYAVAADTTNSTTSAAASATLTVTSTPTPVIGSFAINPTSVVVNSGTSITLTASSVTETGGTVGSVSFYRESNAATGLQTSSDTFVGAATQNGTTWTLSGISTAGLTAAVYTFYALASDSTNATNATASATLTVGSATTTGALVDWETTGQTAYGTQGLAATNVASGVTNSTGLTRGAGVTLSGTAAANGWGGTGWNSSSAAGITNNESITFGITVGSGYSASLSSIDLNYRRSNSGPSSGYWQYQVNGGTWGLIGDFSSEFSSASSSGAAITEISLTGISPLQGLAAGSVVNLRVIPYGATNSGGSLYIYGPVTGNDLIVNGSVSAVSTSAPLVLTGPANYLKLDADGVHVDVWNANTSTGTIAQQALLSQVSSMSYTGTSADDSLTVDFSAGNPIVSGGLSFNGGTGGTNALTVTGTSANDTFVANATSVNLTSTFGTAAITYSNTTNLAINTGAGTDVITQTAQPGANLVLGDPASNDTLNVNAGNFTLPASAGSATTSLSLGTLHISAGSTVTAAAATSHSQRTVLVLGTLDDAGTLDLKDNDLIVHSTTYATLLTELQAGFSNGAWTGPGITSTTAAGDTAHLTTLGILQNNNGSGSPIYGSSGALGTFDGQDASTTDVLVKFTYYGDANLSGAVDASDYTRIDSTFVTGGANGWFNGDFNYDGAVNGSDYTLIDNAFNVQGTKLSAVQTAGVASTFAATSPAIGAKVASKTAVTRWEYDNLNRIGAAKTVSTFPTLGVVIDENFTFSEIPLSESKTSVSSFYLACPLMISSLAGCCDNNFTAARL